MKKKVVVPLVIAFGVTCMSMGAFAASSVEQITAYLNKEINIKLDGRLYVPKDQDGEIMDPIIYNGSTYLPLRSVAEALNVEVGWNGATQTVDLWTEKGQASRPATDITGGGGSNSKPTPGVALDDSNAPVKDGMSTYTFDKAFAQVHSLALKKAELSDITSVNQFMFQGVKEYWNQSPTKHEVEHKTLYNDNAYNSALFRHYSYVDNTFFGLSKLTFTLEHDYSSAGTLEYSFKGTSVKSTNGGQSFYKVKVRGNAELGIAKNGDVRFNSISLEEYVDPYDSNPVD
jgi:hypothetical protein